NDDGDFNDEGEIAYANLLVEKTEERFKIENITCDKTKCSVVIYNTVKDSIIIFIRLISEPGGTIHYSSNLDVKPESTGMKEAILSTLAHCRQGTKLKILAIAYKQNDLENPLDTYKADGFIC
ncbi:MAG: hypothetical protein QXQ40_02130, partial [Candidatus Aenigmatarchaeota archaeon]